MKKTHLFLLALSLFCLVGPAFSQAQVPSEGQPAVLKDEANPPNYVYDLKQLIKKSRENIKNVDLKIKEQAVVKRNQKREEKAREYYEQAMKLQEEGRLEEARQIFEKAIRITDHPEMQGYIKDSGHRARLQEDALKKEEDDQERRLTEEERLAFQKAEDEYQVAVNLYRQQKFKEAKTAFEVVEQTSPDYKAVRSYLQIINQDIANQDSLLVKEQKKEIERQQKEVEDARLREKDIWRKEIEEKEEARTRQMKNQADEAYNSALKLYQEKKYQAAKEKFQEVDWVIPDFKATRAYLGRIDQDIENEKKRVMSEREKELEKQRWAETLAQRKSEAEREKALQLKEKERQAQLRDQADFIYGAAVTLFEKNNYAQAKEKFDEVESIYPNYKLTHNYLKKLEQLLGLPSGERPEADLATTLAGKSSEEQKQILEEEAARRKADQDDVRKISVAAEDAFNAAIGLYKSGRLIEAKEKFLSVDRLIPDYKSTRSYLKRIDDDIELLARTHKHEQVLLGQKAELERLKLLKEKAEVLYAAALSAFDVRDFARAKSGFQEVESNMPDYKKTKFYLLRTEEEIVKQQAEQKRQELERQANVTYAQAVVLYTTGQLEEAKRKFIEVEALSPNYKDVTNYLEHIDDDIIAKKEKDLARLKELQVEGPYAEALALYQIKDFQSAKRKFLEVMAVYPEYKDTAVFLNKIDDDIARQRKENDLREKTEQADALYRQAVELYQAGDFVSAKDKFVRLEVIWPDYKEAPRYLGRIDGDIAMKKRKDELARLSSEAQPIYDQAVALYKEQEFLEAKKKFMQVQVLLPGYRDTAHFLSRIDTDIKGQEERVARYEQLRKADELYTLALNLYAQKQYEEAKVKLLETASVDPNYKNLRSYLGRVDNDIRMQAATTRRQKDEQAAEEPYASGVALYHESRFAEAKDKFLETSRILPDYKKVRSYLARIDQDIRNEQRANEQERIARAVALYREAQSLKGKQKLADAFNKFSELEVLYPDYKDTRTQLNGLKDRIGELPSSEAEGAVTSLAAGNVAAVPSEASGSNGDEKVLGVYKEAVSLFKAKKYDTARARFQQVSTLKPNYRSTDKYLQSIEEILGTQKKAEIVAEKVQPSPKPVKVLAAVVSATKAESNEPAAQTEALYKEATKCYASGKYADAKSKFEQIESESPNYKSVRKYLALSSKALEKSLTPPVVLSPKDAEALRVLARRSEAIFQQIKELAQDREMADALNTFSQVDKKISVLEAEQKRLEARVAQQQRQEREALLRQKKQEEDSERLKTRKYEAETEQLREAGEKKAVEDEQIRLADLKAQEKEKVRQEQRAMDIRVEQAYQRAVEAYQNKEYSKAREAFSEIETIRPHYRDCASIMTKMDREESEGELLARENNDRKMIADQVDRARTINLEVIQLTEARDYAAVHRKFDELTGILQEIKNIKERMLARRKEFASQWEKRVAKAKTAPIASQRSPEQLLAAVDSGIYASQARAVLREGEKLYSAQKYFEAKAKFSEAEKLDPHLQAAATYLRRIRRLEEQRDFEAQKERNKRQHRDLEKKEELKKYPSLAGDNEGKEGEATAVTRSDALWESGTALYREQRYREARIKFEELVQIGDKKQASRARKYLSLIEKALEKDTVVAEKKRQAERDNYLRERRAQDTTRSLTRGERDMEIQRQQELRMTEEQNQQERGRLAKDSTPEKEAKSSVNTQAGVLGGEKISVRKEDRSSAAKTDKGRRNEAGSSSGGNTVLPASSQAGVETKNADAPVVAAMSKPVAKKNSPENIKIARAAAERDRLVKRERMRLQKEASKRQEDLAQERLRFMREKALIEKADREEARNRKGRVEVLTAAGEAAREISQTSSPKVSVNVTLSTAPDVQEGSRSEVPNTSNGPISIESQKRRLEQQREAIRRDFEIGVERLYNEAVSLFRGRMYVEAKQNFLQVEEMIRGYKKTGYFLIQIERILNAGQLTTTRAATAVPVARMSGSSSGQAAPESRRKQVISWELDALEAKPSGK